MTTQGQGTGPSATASRNQAAERLREMVDSQPFDGPFAQVLDAALSEERRRLEGEQIAQVYARQWEIAADGQAVIPVEWVLRLLNDPRASR